MKTKMRIVSISELMEDIINYRIKNLTQFNKWDKFFKWYDEFIKNRIEKEFKKILIDK